MSLITCPSCDGAGGFKDYFGEYDECLLCEERGEVELELAFQWHKANAEMDRWIEAEVARDEASKVETASDKPSDKP
jgi:hypothetical protein